MRSAEGLGSCSDDARGLSALCGFVLLRSRHSSASKVFSRHPSCLNSEIRIRVTLRSCVLTFQLVPYRRSMCVPCLMYPEF